MENKRFTVRAYALLICAGDVLVSDEYIFGRYITKFPGGGLEWGEGLKEGLSREISEELGIEIKEWQHFYTTDFFVQSAFSENVQVISVYYTHQIDQKNQIKTATTTPFNLDINDVEPISNRWVCINQLLAEPKLTLIIDLHVAKMLMEYQSLDKPF